MLGALPALLPRRPRRVILVRQAVTTATAALAPWWLARVASVEKAVVRAFPQAWSEPLLRNRREIAATCLATIGIALLAAGAGLF